jgi:plasmid stability protein
VRRRCFGDVGPFDAGVPLGADYQKWLQIALQHEVDYVSGPVAEYAIHAGNTSRDLVRTLRCRAILFERALEQASDPEARAIWRHALFNLHVSLALALARSGGSGLRELIGQRPAGPPGLSLWRRVDWLARFAGEQLRVRSAHLRPRRMEAEAAGPEATSPRRAARPG